MITKQLERLRRIEALLAHSDRIHLKEVSRTLEVSEMTVRRDLNSDAGKQTPLDYYGGYITLKTKVQYEHNYLPLQEFSTDENQLISSLASAIVEDGDFVFFDDGKEIPDIVSSISEQLTFTGVCHSLQTFLALRNKQNCKAILIGGAYDPTTDCFVVASGNPFDKYVFNKAFISALGIDKEFGATCNHINNAIMKSAVIRKSVKKYLVVGTRAIGAIKPAQIGSLQDFDFLVTNDEIPKDIITACKQANLRIL